MLYVVLVSMHAQIWFTTYYSCICQAKVQTSETCEVSNMHACANQNVQVQFMQIKDTCVLFVQTMMHTAAK